MSKILHPYHTKKITEKILKTWEHDNKTYQAIMFSDGFGYISQVDLNWPSGRFRIGNTAYDYFCSTREEEIEKLARRLGVWNE